MNTKLFLDIDGVLNNRASLEKFGNLADFHSAIFENRPFELSKINFDIDCVNRVKRLQYLYNLDIVICSNWRFNAAPKHFIELFKLYAWRLDTISLIDTILYESTEFNRSKIIEKYILENDVKDFIIIDDTVTHYDRFFNNIVFTNKLLGFTDDDFKKAEILVKRFIVW